MVWNSASSIHATFADLSSVAVAEYRVCVRFGALSSYLDAGALRVVAGHVCTFAGTGAQGSVDGIYSSATFHTPHSLVQLASSGEIFVTDSVALMLSSILHLLFHILFIIRRAHIEFVALM